MYIFYSLICFLICSALAVGVAVSVNYFFKNYSVPLSYIISFPMGAIFRAFVFSHEAGFATMLKESFLVSVIFVLIILNLRCIKNRLSKTGEEAKKIKAAFEKDKKDE